MRNLKDKKIVLRRKERIKDSAGFGVDKYTPIHEGKLWAYVRQLSAGEFYGAKAVMYNITRIDTFEGYKEDLKIYAAALPGTAAVVPWSG